MPNMFRIQTHYFQPFFLDKPVLGQSADLVCTAPFPCMPVYMYKDDEPRSKYMNAYFSVYQHVWYHGDFVWINPNTKGVIMLGRSDGTLNPSGVRFGSAEIYNVVDEFLPQGITDSLCVGQKIKGEDDERVVLFLKMKDNVELADALIKNIKVKIRSELSPRHVPAFILPIGDIPVNHYLHCTPTSLLMLTRCFTVHYQRQKGRSCCQGT